MNERKLNRNKMA